MGARGEHMGSREQGSVSATLHAGVILESIASEDLFEGLHWVLGDERYRPFDEVRQSHKSTAFLIET